MPDREYFNNRRRERRKKFLQLLGGKCQICNSKEDLHFDHKNPKRKNFNIADKLDGKENDLLKELKNCQILCGKHHRIKTREHEDFSLPASKHGSLRMYIYYKCRCPKCKAAMSAYYQKRLKK